ncbi:MAG: alpha/beta fold hydrolase [Cytophagaceae bacterium]|jgi:pimeloyl-ACP methyl ester carboxylesterase|nr:alpha/beta fold hydrolase [Cytophagaceae bacterium]
MSEVNSGLSVFYRTLGEPQHPPLFILHGLFGSGDNWLTLSKQLSERYFVVVPDARNHGKSPHSDVFHYASMAEDVLRLMDTLNLDKVHLVGHSMGGKTAMNLVSRFPQRIKSLMVVDIAPRYYPPHHQSVLNGFYALPLETLESRQQAEQLLGQHISDEGIKQFMLKNLYRNESGAFAWRMNLPVISKHIEEIGQAQVFPSAISLPIMFVRGERSDYIRNEDWDSIRQVFPQASLTTVAGAGHWVQAEKPQEFAQILLNFLNACM